MDCLLKQAKSIVLNARLLSTLRIIDTILTVLAERKMKDSVVGSMKLNGISQFTCTAYYHENYCIKYFER